MPTLLKLGVDTGGGETKLEKFANALDKVGSSLSTLDTSAKTSQGAVKAAAATITGLAEKMQQAAAAAKSASNVMAGFKTTIDSLWSGGKLNSGLQEFSQNIAAVKADLRITQQSLTDFITTSGKYAEVAKRQATATYEVSAGLRAQEQAITGLLGIEGAYVNSLAKEALLNNEAAISLQAKTAAINANVAAYGKMVAAGNINAGYNKERNYTSLAKEFASEDALIEHHVAVLKEAELAERQLQAARNASLASSMSSNYAGQDKLRSGYYASQIAVESKLYDENTGALKRNIEELAKYDKTGKLINAAEIANAFDDFSKSADVGARSIFNLGDAWDNAGKKSSTFHNLLRGASGAMGQLWMTYGQMIPMITGFATVAATLKTVNVGSEFDYSARMIQKLSGEAYSGADALTAIKTSLLDMRGLVHTPNELAGGMLEFARAGIPAAEAAKELAEVSKFSFLGGMDMGKTVETVVGLMSAFKDTNATANLNQIATVADKTSVSLSQMADAFKNTTSLGTVMGMEFKDVAVSLGVLGQAGVRGATAGAALTTMMYKLAAPTATTRKNMQELGLSFDVFDEGSGKMKSMVQIAEELAQKTKGMNSKEVSGLFESMVGLRGVKALGALVAMASKGTEEFNKLKTAVEDVANLKPGEQNTYLSKMFSDVSESGKVQLMLLKGDLDRLFTANYDNSSVVNAIKDLDSLINEPGTAKALKTITTLVLELANAILTLINIAAKLYVPFQLAEDAGKKLSDIVVKTIIGKEKFKSLEDLKAKTGEAFDPSKLEEYGAAADKLESHFNTLKTQLTVLSSNKLELIENERIEEISKLKQEIAGSKLSQEEFNDKLKEGTELINKVYDAKIAEALRKELKVAESEWEAYYIQALAASNNAITSAADAAIQIANTTAQALDEIANKSMAAAQSMAAATYTATQQAGQGIVASVGGALKSGLTTYFKEVVNQVGAQQSQGQANAALDALKSELSLYAAQGQYESMPRSQQLQAQRTAGIVQMTEKYAGLNAELKKYLMNDKDLQALKVSGSSSKSYKGTAFSAELVAGAPEDIRKSIDEAATLTVTAISTRYAPKISEAFKSENKKIGAAANKAMRQELSATRAELSLAANEAAAQLSSNKDWLKDFDKYSNKLYNIQVEVQTMGMTEAEKELYNLTAEFDKAYKALDWYGTALENNQKLIDSTAAAIEKLKSQLGDAEGSMSNISIISDPQKQAAAMAATNQLKKLESDLSTLQANRIKLQEMQDDYPAISREEYQAALKAEQAVKSLTAAYSSLGPATEAISKQQIKNVEDQYKLNQAVMGGTEAWLLYQEALANIDFSSAEVKITSLMQIGFGKANKKLQEDTTSFFEDALPQAVDGTASAMSDFARAMMEGTASASDAWKAMGETINDVVFDILQEMIKLQLKAAILGASSSIFNGLFGSTSSVSSGTSGGAWTNDSILSGWHSGGTIGYDAPTFTRQVSIPQNINSVPRYHSGLMSDEFLTILQKGETVLTRDQQQVIGSGLAAKSGGDVYIDVINNSSSAQTTQKSYIDGRGQRRVELTIADAVSTETARSGSTLNSAIKGTFGLTQRMIGR